MISSKKVINELIQENNNLLKSFLPYSNYSFNFESIKNFKKFQTVIVIGMGGSILGAKAIYSFLKYKIKKEFVFINDLDQGLLKKIKKEYNLSKSLFLVVSKSGNTNDSYLSTNINGLWNRGNSMQTELVLDIPTSQK